MMKNKHNLKEIVKKVETPVFLLFLSVIIFFGLNTVVFAKDNEDDLKDDAKKTEKKLDKADVKLKEAQGVLSNVQNSLSVKVQHVSRTEDQLGRIKGEIEEKEDTIASLAKQLNFQKTVLKSTMRELYYISNDRGMAGILVSTKGHNSATQRDHMEVVRDRIIKELSKIERTKKKVDESKKELVTQKKQQGNLLERQKKEQQALAVTRNKVANEVQERSASVSELRNELSAIRGKLASLLGKSIDTDDIVEAAKIASKATGVRKSFILGELVVETNLGSYTGGCTYKETRMRDRDKEALKRIANELDINYKKVKISCSASYGYGGAMGVAQFMPTTWEGYRSRIAAATGHKHPDPWNLIDGVTAMALYLKDKGGDSKSGEYIAAKRYYCGSSNSSYWNTKCNDYADKVKYWTKNYKRLLD